MTVQQVAEYADVSPVTYSALENGRRRDCSLATAARICETLGLQFSLGLRGQTQLPPIPPTSRRRVRGSR